jgi:very-short-patch-repair endonuclease
MALSHEQRQRARQLRREQVKAEAGLWNRLRDRRLGGFKFRRQAPVGPYFVDFACVESKLVVEVDGDTHVGRENYDERRTGYLNNEGWLVMRFWNSDVYNEIEMVLTKILAACVERTKRARSEG